MGLKPCFIKSDTKKTLLYQKICDIHFIQSFFYSKQGKAVIQMALIS